MRLLLACVSVLCLPATAWAGSIKTAEQIVMHELREPASARFLDARFIHTWNTRGEPVDAVCGSISAKNGQGGMSAASHFVYMVGHDDAYLTDPSIALTPYKAQLGQLAFAHLCLLGR